MAAAAAAQGGWGDSREVEERREREECQWGV